MSEHDYYCEYIGAEKCDLVTALNAEVKRLGRMLKSSVAISERQRLRKEDAEAKLARMLPPGGHWTREPPTEPGWYLVSLPTPAGHHGRRETAFARVRKSGEYLVFDCLGCYQGASVEHSTSKGDGDLWSVRWWSEPEQLPEPPKEGSDE